MDLGICQHSQGLKGSEQPVAAEWGENDGNSFTEGYSQLTAFQALQEAVEDRNDEEREECRGD